MKKSEKHELFLHWVVHTAVKNLFKEKLSKAEVRQIYLILTFCKMSEIADMCFLHEKTIKFHRTNILKKLKPQFRMEREGTKSLLYGIFYHCMTDTLNDDFYQTWKEKFNRSQGIPYMPPNMNSRKVVLPMGSEIIKQGPLF